MKLSPIIVFVSSAALLSGCATPLCPGCSPLSGAVANGDYTTTKELLSKGADINAKSVEGQSPLHYAATRSDVELARILIENGANIEARNNNGETPLYTAIRYGSERVALYLIEKGADVKASIPEGYSVLTKAAGRKNLDLIKSILAKGADPEVADGQGHTPLFVAAESGNEEVFFYLLDAKKNQGEGRVTDNSPLFAAARRGSTKIVAALIDSGVSPDAKTPSGITPLMVAAYYGHGEIAKLLVDKGADKQAVSPVYGNALHAAIMGKNLPIADYLVANDAQPIDIDSSLESIYSSGISHQMVGEKLASRTPSQARALLTKASELFERSIKQSETSYKETNSALWKTRFGEALGYFSAGLAKQVPGSNVAYGNAGVDIYLAAQGKKMALEEARKRLEEINTNSKQRLDQCQSTLSTI